MSVETIEKFVRSLRKLERQGDAEEMISLFGEDSELSNLSHVIPYKGAEGARKFWHGYLSAFQEVQTQFTRVVEAGTLAILEWNSEGKLPSGRDFSCDGITVIDLRNGRIARFKAYYDTAIFLQYGSKHAA